MRKWEIITPEHNLYFLYQILRGKAMKEVETNNLTNQSFTEIMETAFKISISHQLFVNSGKCKASGGKKHCCKILLSKNPLHSCMLLKPLSRNLLCCKKGDMKDEIIST